jgi:hypothetical protein
VADNDDEEGVQDPMSAFAELLEMQRQLEEQARNIVTMVRTVVDNREKLVPANLRDFPGYDSKFYDGTAKELGGLGLRLLGDFADASMVEKPVEQRAFYRFALSEAGGTTAYWFVVPGKEPLRVLFLQSWLEAGGSITTARGAVESSIPQHPLVRTQILKPGTATGKLVDAHGKTVAASGGIPRRLRTIEDVLAAREAESRMIAEFREAEGLRLFEPMLRGMLGDGYDEQGEPLVEAILEHPEWWTGEKESSTSPTSAGAPTVAGRDSPLPMMFVSSQEGGRGLLTTFGLMMQGLPELQMKQLAANHWRAGRFLMGEVAKKLRDHPLRLEDPEAFHSGFRNGFTVTLGQEDISAGQPMVEPGRYPQVDSGVAGPVAVRLILEGLTEKKTDGDDTELLHLLPPLDYRSDKDTWLRDSCRALGHNAPNPLPAASLDAEMQKASEKARATLGAVREQFRRGLPPDQTLAIKIGLTTISGGREFVWIKVNEWGADGILTGTLETEPTQCPGFLLGQVMRVPESDVFDRAIGTAQGMIDPALTDVVAQEFGVDL